MIPNIAAHKAQDADTTFLRQSVGMAKFCPRNADLILLIIPTANPPTNEEDEQVRLLDCVEARLV